MLFKYRFGKFNSRLVKLLLKERIVNLQSGNKYLFQVWDCKITKKNNSVVILGM